MIKGGYILQPRKFDKSDAARLPPVTREVWFYLLRNVNHKYNGKFKRGSNFFSLGCIQEDLSWYVGFRKSSYSRTQVAKAIRRLREDAMITTMKTTRGLIITVCNYDVYQDPKSYEDYSEDATKTQRRRNEGMHYKQECKNERMKEETTLSASNAENIKSDFYLTKRKRKLGGEKLEWFNHFWEAFDLKRGKAEAADSWLDIQEMNRNLAAIIYKAAKAEASNREKLNPGQTPKWAQGWLSGKRWEDETQSTATRSNNDYEETMRKLEEAGI